MTNLSTKSFVPSLLLAFLLCWPCSFVVAEQDSLSELSLVKSRYFDEVKILSSTNFSQFSKVYVVLPKASFSESWKKKHLHKVKERYVEETIDRYAEMFKARTEDEFRKFGKYSISETSDEEAGLLVIKPEIIDLDIFAPDHRRRSDQYVRSAGNVTLSAEVYRGDGALIAIFEDNRDARKRGLNSQEKADEVFNQREFGRLMSLWAKQMIKQLERLSDQGAT